jgi:5-formyltetrahydrofolate cyclo-ligase
MTKEQLRIKYRSLRSTLTDEIIDFLTEQCINILFEKFDHEHKKMGIFLPIKVHREPNLFLLFEKLKFSKTCLFAPKSQIDTNEMIFYQINSEKEIEFGPYHIPEPISSQAIDKNELDLILIPLLTFDSRGYRVGYGKGYYDKYLKNASEKTLKIGISLFDELEVIEDLNPHDVKLDFCITPKRLIKFNK